MFNSKKALNTFLAVGYGVYLTLNCSREQKQAIKAEIEAKRQQQQAVQPQEVTTQSLQTEVEHEAVEVAEVVTKPTVEDVWLAPLQATRKPRWATVGTIHTITTQLLLAPVLEVAEQPPIVDYSSWTVKALKDEAKKHNVKAYYNLRKAELIERLTA